MKRAATVAVLLAAGLATAALAQTRLELKHPEGPARVTSMLSYAQTLTIAGQQLPTAVDVTTAARRTVGKPAEDGTRRLEEKQEGFKFRLSLPGDMSAEFDSARAENKTDVPQLEPVFDGFKVLADATYTYVLDRDGKVVNVEGLDKIRGALPAASLDSFKDPLDVETLKREMQQEFGRLPDRPVNKGDRWQRTETMTLGGGQQFTFVVHYEYQGTVEKDGKTLDRISMLHESVKYAQDPDGPNPLKHVRSDLKIESSMGSVLFDRETGTVVEVSSVVRIAGPMTFDANGMELPGNLNLTMNSRTVSKRE
jgi:hypothetical protein